MRTIRYYGYDANGERVYKLTGESSIDFLGQGIADATVQFDDAVLYPNPYLTVTSQGYTKHYYANGERLASVIGHGGWYAMSSDPIDLPSPEEKDKQELIKTQYDYTYPLDRKDVYSITDHNEDIEGVEQDKIQYDCDCNQLRWISVAWEPDLLYLTMDANTHPNGYPEDEIYYTHSDHLGSSAWITDSYADPIQYLHYLPYGELLANKQRTTYDERYKFIGKERDWESGYDYFGARYYISPFLHWMSVDPLSDEDPGISPYAYCHWNPVKNVDPDGRADYYDVDGNHLCNDGVADNRVFQQSDKGDVVLGGLAMPFSYVGDVTSVKLEFNGEMEKNNHMAIGQLSLKQIGDNFEFVRASYEAISGTKYTKDCLPNGDYNTFKFQNRTDNAAMIRDGVGFSINLKPLFLTMRDLLRIHPDGGKVTGTEGCIGLTGNQSDLNSFINLMRPLYSSYGNIPLNVNVKNNPNNHHF